MTVLEQHSAPARCRWVALAWLWMALVPLGFLLSVVVLLLVAVMLDAELMPASGSPQVSLAEALLLGAASTLVVFVAPTVAVVYAERAARGRERSAAAARVVAWGLLVLTSVLFIVTVSTFGVVGVVVVAVVLHSVLRRGPAQPPTGGGSRTRLPRRGGRGSDGGPGRSRRR
jgi:hypothetical protein